MWFTNNWLLAVLSLILGVLSFIVGALGLLVGTLGLIVSVLSLMVTVLSLIIGLISLTASLHSFLKKYVKPCFENLVIRLCFRLIRDLKSTAILTTSMRLFRRIETYSICRIKEVLSIWSGLHAWKKRCRDLEMLAILGMPLGIAPSLLVYWMNDVNFCWRLKYVRHGLLPVF